MIRMSTRTRKRSIRHSLPSSISAQQPGRRGLRCYSPSHLVDSSRCRIESWIRRFAPSPLIRPCGAHEAPRTSQLALSRLNQSASRVSRGTLGAHLRTWPSGSQLRSGNRRALTGCPSGCRLSSVSVDERGGSLLARPVRGLQRQTPTRPMHRLTHRTRRRLRRRPRHPRSPAAQNRRSPRSHLARLRLLLQTGL